MISRELAYTQNFYIIMPAILGTGIEVYISRFLLIIWIRVLNTFDIHCF